MRWGYPSFESEKLPTVGKGFEPKKFPTVGKEFEPKKLGGGGSFPLKGSVRGPNRVRVKGCLLGGSFPSIMVLK